MRFKAVLFDLDGTLVDTVGLYGEAVQTSFADFGAPMTEAEYRKTYSAGLHLTDLMAMFGLDSALEDDLRAHRDETYKELLRTRSVWLPGAEEILSQTLSRPRAIITGSWMSYVDAIHAQTQIHDHFKTIITADEIHTHMKPDPFGLLLAAKRLNIDPIDAVYIGDQPFDAEAAKRAGMKSILIRGPYTPEGAALHADIEVSSLMELREQL